MTSLKLSITRAPAMLWLLPVTVASAAQEFTEISIEELMNKEVTSVSRSSQKFADSAAAVFVLTADDIRRSGVTTLPEALRMAPGVHVARINASQWAISIRGFNGRFANKLLVLVDGRSVYTPIFSGVHWEALDLPLNDIERIEIIRGPGASLWGANAVNGIINVITKNAKDTQGGLVNLTAGNQGRLISDLRYGAQASDPLHFRVYGRYTDRDGLLDRQDGDAKDDWRQQRGGFRLDWLASASDAVRLQGELYALDLDRNFALADPTAPGANRRLLDRGDFQGYSLLGHWEHAASLASRTGLQIYFQSEQRSDAFTDYRLQTFDIDFQHEFAPSPRQELIWGLGYRYNSDDFEPAEILSMTPAARDYSVFSAFLQDRLSLSDDRLELTFGIKIEHNDFTGWEFQPSVRGLWKPSAKQRLWAALSRATRTPARGEHDNKADILGIPAGPDNPPAVGVLQGNRDFRSEVVLAYELGWRFWPSDTLYLDFAAFFNEYDRLRSAVLEPVSVGPTGLQLPITIVNGEKGFTYGFEWTADWRPTAHWRLQGSYSFLRADLQSEVATVTFPQNLGDARNPRHQLSVRSSLDLPRDLELDFWLRYVDKIPVIQIATPDGLGSVDDYLTLDLRLGWRPVRNLELAIGGRNLIDARRIEFLRESNTIPTRLERSLYGQIKWRY